jgi:hypothetical protein
MLSMTNKKNYPKKSTYKICYYSCCRGHSLLSTSTVLLLFTNTENFLYAVLQHTFFPQYLVASAKQLVPRFLRVILYRLIDFFWAYHCRETCTSGFNLGDVHMRSMEKPRLFSLLLNKLVMLEGSLNKNLLTDTILAGLTVGKYVCWSTADVGVE